MCHPDITVLVDWAQNIKLFTYLILTYLPTYLLTLTVYGLGGGVGSIGDETLLNIIHHPFSGVSDIF